jgi:Na+/melibiose symporter-like transporter
MVESHGIASGSLKEAADLKPRMARKQYPEDFKTMFGLSTLNWVNELANAFMTGLFLIYLTDYAGIGSLAATLGTSLLVLGRILDAVDDPLQGFIMDNAKTRKIGRYKPFIIISIVLTAVAICMLFGIPSVIASNAVLVVVWVAFFYILYDIGSSFFAEAPLKQSLTTDPVIRSRMTTWPRISSMLVVIPMAFFLPILTGVNSGIGDMHKTFAIVTAAFVVPVGLISLLGIALVKEGKHIEHAQGERITLKDFVFMLKNNKPWMVSTVTALFNGFVWTLVFATSTYYVKWAYSTNLITGVVDTAKFASLTTILGAFQLGTTIFMAAIAPSLVKRFNGPLPVYKLSMWLQVIGGVGLFLSMLLGILGTTPALFFAFLTLILMGGGLGFVPGTLIGIETMDYGMFTTGKEMHGMLGATGRFIGKAQTALSSALVGAVLISIGYQVNSVTDTFIGDLTAIPNMLRWFIIICGLIPAILSLIALFALRYYPITNEMRAKMSDAISEMKKA